ncbi:MAG TPA: hypothetical protein VMV60_11600 [Thermoanaerobaculia bacterium]|nr:hypothetical protein [Thermoanaerobaculia bacterium]
MRLRSRRAGWAGRPRRDAPSAPASAGAAGSAGGAPSPRAAAEKPLDAWRVLATMRPGEPGTKRILRDWGPRLVCVRYRYNPALKRRVTTAEIVMNEGPWRHKRFEEVGIAIRSWENDLRQAIVEAGGLWDRGLALWVLPKKRAERLGLGDRLKPIRRDTSNGTSEVLKVTITGDQNLPANGNLPSHIPSRRDRP